MEINDNDFKQLIGLLQQLVSNQSQNSAKQKTQQTTDKNNEDEDFDAEEEIEQQSSPVIKNKKSKSVVKKTKFVNKFLQMKEANMHQSDAEIDKKLNKYPPTQRGREYSPVEVKCRVCGKNDQVHPSLVESKDRYKCNNCSTSQG